ncbi:putative disease resistance RPP13-like protein 1 isoform X2 [Miscanthus floridulus]|uniref:putative disease resistance RPP13-like protein 1 isoform X2 n=1 Tax=Miscanthus floridulus TaxID=154761 RepID=UPI00345A3454
MRLSFSGQQLSMLGESMVGCKTRPSSNGRSPTPYPWGNWVLITTRLEDLALQTRTSFYQHHVSPLNKDDAWSLLNKQLLPTPGQVHGTDHLKVVGMKIISKCGGLPLAIKVMGGLLSTKPLSEGDWEAVLKHHAWSVAGLPKELDNAIYLSYEDLSPQLKQCFLYCSLFPKGKTIWQRQVVPMWISEGFIHPPDRSSSSCDDYEIADGYYQELITRNLIEPKSALTRYSCTMHDVVRSFAEFMSKEESLVVQDQQDDGGSKISHVRHLSIGSTKSALEWDILQKHKSVRTLIINKRINVQPSDSFGRLSALRVLFIRGTDCDRLVDSLCQLRHLRYLHLRDTNISSLPGDIHRMKFLQHIVVARCPQLDHLPSCITQLLHLRTLSMYGSHDNVLIPKGFGQLKNLRTLFGFRVHLDKNGGTGWCSLEEIGPLSQLRVLTLHGLENVPASSSAGMAMVSSKEHLDYLELHWSRSGFMELRDEINKQQQQRVVEEVIEKLSPPSSIRHLIIKGYFGSRLPNWMMVPATCGFKSLRILRMDKLHYCTQLPDGLCQLPCLERLAINNAPTIRSVGPQFQSPSPLAVGIITASSVVAFRYLSTLRLAGLCEWEEWVWEEQGEDVTVGTVAMPALKGLTIANCKLRCLPPGLASSRRHALRELYLYKLSNLTYIENFPSVVELRVFDCPKLRRISDISKLQKIRISHCRNLEELKGVPSLDSMEMRDGTMKMIPQYLTTVTPRYLKLTCSKRLYESLLTGSSSEYDKISHIKSRTVCAED